MKNIKHLFVLLSIFMLWNTNQIQAQVGIFTNTGDLTLTTTAAYEAEIKDITGPGTGHDQVVISGDLALDGTLDIILLGYSPDVIDDFEIMCYSGILSGTFSTINWPADMVSQGWQIDYGVLNPGCITIYAGTLPVELMSFSVTQKNGLHLLSWGTATEINNDFFSVEHSTNGLDFSTVGQVASKGNQAGIQEYNFTNRDNRSGYHYYRLQQVDLDGKYTYSKIVVISNSSEQATFFPNPTNGSITFSEPVSELLIYDIESRLVLEIKNPGTTFDLSNLPAGTFFVKTNEASSVTEKLIITK